MFLVVKQGGRTVNEFRSDKGPVSIGRGPDNNILLPNKAVSKKHAVIFNAENGKWTVEDMDSANKTYLNDQAVHKAEIKTGDVLHIADFTIEVNFDHDTIAGKTVFPQDTSTASVLARGPQIISRELDTPQSPPIRFPSARAKDFMQATEAICKANSTDKVLLALLDVVAKQFNTYHVWCALRNQPAGPMTCHAGRQRDGQAVELSDIKLNENITQAVEKSQFLLFLFSRIPNQVEQGQIRSAVIAPVMSPAGCFGALYADNAIGDEHYSLSDLDYLMILGIHTTARLTNL